MFILTSCLSQSGIFQTIFEQGLYLLLEFLISLLLVVLQVHDVLLGQFQVSLQLPLASLQVHTELLLLLQRTLQLRNKQTCLTLI